jgi:hypothetical protein
MQTTWVWLIVTDSGYFTGAGFSIRIRDVASDGFFFSQDAARFYAVNVLELAEENIQVCCMAV